MVEAEEEAEAFDPQSNTLTTELMRLHSDWLMTKDTVKDTVTG